MDAAFILEHFKNLGGLCALAPATVDVLRVGAFYVRDDVVSH